MAAVKYLDLTGLGLNNEKLKELINSGDAKSFKTAKFDESTRILSLYKAESTEGTAEFTVEIPETDISGLLEKIADGTVGNIVTVGADGTVVDSGVALTDLATKSEVEDVDGKADANAEAIEAINNAETGILKQAKDYTDAEVKELADGQVKSNTDSIAKLNGDATTEGSVAKAVKDASDAINATIGTVEDGKTVVGMIEEVIASGYDDTELSGKVTANEEAIADLDAEVGDLTTLKTTEKTSIVGAINEVSDSVATAAEDAKVTISTATTTEGYLKSYTIAQGGTNLAVIDIPKDLVVTSGEVVVDPEGQTTGTYVKLTIANQETPIYINVADLVDAYTAQQNANQIQLVISDVNEISATIVAGSVGTTELADGGITTAKIADANVTAAKLADDAKLLFDAAGSAQAAETNAKAAVTALEEGAVADNATAIEALEAKVGDGIEAITPAEIEALFNA